MRRALIGFSSPAGYSYKWQAAKTANDGGSSPNPVLLASMGLFVLYDELWFACESLCPQSMRTLPYVRFVDREWPGLHPKAQGLDEFVESVRFQGDASINEMFVDGYEGMRRFYSPRGLVDNHTHGLRFYDTGLSGNCGPRQLATDIWLVAHLRHLNLNLVLNPVTARYAFGGEASPGEGLDRAEYDALRVAEAVVSLRSLYDIAGRKGPYHPCVEELRDDRSIVAFRRWLVDKSGTFNNRELRDIEEEIDARVREFTVNALQQHAGRRSLKAVAVDLIKDQVGSALGIPFRVLEYLGGLGSARQEAAYAFIGKARLRQP
ncbi:hypothetical protein [Phenylobacterium sp.]|jgi:hypothetical protein|uniref:hypothetical protein n=1 Tax=Phenylobacterium sp. TaxID=1871053 RepID=UPI002F946697